MLRVKLYYLTVRSFQFKIHKIVIVRVWNFQTHICEELKGKFLFYFDKYFHLLDFWDFMRKFLG